MILLTKELGRIRKTPVALFATRPQVPVPAHCLVLPAASPLISLTQTASHRDVTPVAYVRLIKFRSPPLVCTDLMQETIWLTVKTATEPPAPLTLMAGSHPPAAQTTLPAIPMPGPIPLIGRGKMTQRRIIDPATATRGTRLIPAPSATISLKADQHLIQPRPAASQTTSEVTNVMRAVQATVTTTDLRIGICQYPRAGG